MTAGDSDSLLTAVGVTIFVLGFLIVFGVVIFVIVKAVRRQAGSAGRLSTLAAELGVALTGKTLRVERSGVALELTWTPGGRNRPSTLAARVAGAAAAPPVILRRETGFDRLGKRLGISREFVTGDLDFDRELYLESDADEMVLLQLSGNPALRDAARALICLHGYGRLEFSPQGLAAVASPPLPAQFTAAGFEPAAAALATVARALPGFAPQQLRVPAPWLTIAAMAGVIAFDALGVAVMAVSWAQWPLLDGWPSGVGALAGLLAVPFQILALIPFLRGRATSFRNFAIAAGISLIGLPLLGAGLVVGANGALDRSAPTVHATTVTRTYTTRHKNSTSYHVEVRSWRAGETTHTFDVGYGFYAGVESKSPVTVTTRAGRFGWEWLVGLKQGERK